MLVDHSDSRSHRVARALKILDDSVQHNFATVGGVQPIENIHERRLAGSVFAQQAVDFARFNNEVDVVVCHKGAEPFRDAAELKLHG